MLLHPELPHGEQGILSTLHDAHVADDQIACPSALIAGCDEHVAYPLALYRFGEAGDLVGTGANVDQILAPWVHVERAAAIDGDGVRPAAASSCATPRLGASRVSRIREADVPGGSWFDATRDGVRENDLVGKSATAIAGTTDSGHVLGIRDLGRANARLGSARGAAHEGTAAHTLEVRHP